jgi:outer membrane lipoprotein SlyB
MKRIVIIACLVLAGCAVKDNYVPVSGNSSQQTLQSDLAECRYKAWDAYYQGRGVGILIGGGLGGAVGGVIGGSIAGASVGAAGGAVAGSMGNNEMNVKDVHSYTLNCMKNHGYNVVEK